MAVKFAFETGRISIAYPLIGGLGDCVIAKKVFDAIIEVEPNCAVDIFAFSPNHVNIAKAFFGQSKNLNGICGVDIYQELKPQYDLAAILFGARAVILEQANLQRLQAVSPALLKCIIKLDEYNKNNFLNIGSPNAISLRNAMISRILGKNLYQILSSDGALPIHDDKVDIPLAPEYKPQFDALKLGKYITIYTDIERDVQPPKIKTWSMRYIHEYVSRMKNNFPNLTIIQCGGGIFRSKMSTVTSSVAIWS